MLMLTYAIPFFILLLVIEILSYGHLLKKQTYKVC